MSVAELIRRAIAEFLDKEKQSLKKSARLKKIIKFLVQGSQPQPYELSFEFNKGSLTAYCSCPAGINGMYCKHRSQIFLGNSDGIVSANSSEVSMVGDWLKHSSLNGFFSDLIEAERTLEIAKNELALKKKQFSKALLGRML